MHIDVVRCGGVAALGPTSARLFAPLLSKALGVPVQRVQTMRVDSQAELYADQGRVIDTARRRDDGRTVSTEASCREMLASEMAGRATDRAVQILGGSGDLAEFGLDRFHRAVRLFRLYKGTDSADHHRAQHGARGAPGLRLRAGRRSTPSPPARRAAPATPCRAP